MKYTIKTEIIINAPINDVWNAFRDFSSHSKWNTFLRIHGDGLKIGQSFKVNFLEDGKVKMSMTPTLLEDNTQKSFEWIGHLLIKGLFDGHHKFLFDESTTAT